MWPALDPNRLDETFPGWAAAVGAIVRQNRDISSALSMRYLRLIRAAAGVSGDVPAAAPRELPAPVLLSSLAVTGPVAIKKSMTAGRSLETATQAAFVMSSIAVARHVLNAGRETVMASLEQDDRAEGWQRVTSPRACEFCDSLDDIYPPGYGDFPAHDGCMCVAEPVYR